MPTALPFESLSAWRASIFRRRRLVGGQHGPGTATLRTAALIAEARVVVDHLGVKLAIGSLVRRIPDARSHNSASGCCGTGPPGELGVAGPRPPGMPRTTRAARFTISPSRQSQVCSRHLQPYSQRIANCCSGRPARRGVASPPCRGHVVGAERRDVGQALVRATAGRCSSKSAHHADPRDGNPSISSSCDKRRLANQRAEFNSPPRPTRRRGSFTC